MKHAAVMRRDSAREPLGRISAPLTNGAHLVSTRPGRWWRTVSVLFAAHACTSGGEPPAPPNSLLALRLSPTLVTLAPGEIEQFGALGVRTDGVITVPEVWYHATGGAVSSGGLFTAGARAGTYRVIAVQRDGSLSDSSAVIVSATPLAGANPHEPVGMSVGFDEPFSFSPVGQPVSGWFVESDESAVAVVDDSTAPRSGPSVLQFKFPEGFGGGNAPMRINWNESGKFPPNSGTLYMHLRVKISSNWSNNGNGMTKFLWPRQTETTNHFIPLNWYDDRLRVGFSLQAPYLSGVDHDYDTDRK